MVNDTFQLSPNETYREGLGSFRGGENISLSVQCPTAFEKNFSIIFPTRPYFFIINSSVDYSVLTQSNITYSFIADANYYEAVFVSDSPNVGTVHFQASAQEPNSIFPYSWLNEPSKIVFLLSLGLTMLVMLKMVSSSTKFKSNKLSLPSLSKKNRRYLLILLLLSLMIWLFLIAVNSNPLATFENWYTDNARDSYVSSLFLKDGFSVFNQPLGKLANLDNSSYKFVTWPEMPQLYPLGSIFLFLPFGVLLQKGFDPSLIYKTEIAIFLVFATVCVYFFLKNFLQKDMALLLKLLGVYIIYVSLVVYAADGMFDSVAFLFSLFAIYMFVTERYDYFFLLIAVSVFFKYEAGIFLLPLIIVGLIKLFQTNKLSNLLRNKAVIAGAIFRVCQHLHCLFKRAILSGRCATVNNEWHQCFFIQYANFLGASILLSFADTGGHFGLRTLHAKQEQFAFSVSAFSSLAKFYAALLPKLVSAFHFCIRSDSPAEKRIRDHRNLVNVCYFHARFRCGLL